MRCETGIGIGMSDMVRCLPVPSAGRRERQSGHAQKDNGNMRPDSGAPARRLLLIGMTLAAGLLAGCSSGGSDIIAAIRAISGRVTNASTGNAIAGATVSGHGRSATTDASGNYTLTNLPDTGTLTLSASAAGFDTAAVDITSTTQTAQDFALVPSSGGFDVSQPPPPPVFD